MKPLAALLFTAAAIAGPLTITTQEAVWSNGLDTLRLLAATHDGTGTMPVPFELLIGDGPARSNDLGVIVQPATFGDAATPIELRYVGQLTVDVNRVDLVLSTIPTEIHLPNPVVDDGSRIVIGPGPVARVEVVDPASPLADSAQFLVTTAAPEPSTVAFMLAGLVLMGYGLRRKTVK